MEAAQIARKLVLQTRSKLSARRAKIESVFEDSSHLDFLDLESSLAIWSEVISGRVSSPWPYSGFLKVESKRDFDPIVEAMSKMFRSSGDNHLYCFTDQWYRRGAFIVNPNDLAFALPKLMWKSNDWLKIYTSDFKRALLIDGDRTGSGDNFNELSVHVLGQIWCDFLKAEGLILQRLK